MESLIADDEVPSPSPELAMSRTTLLLFLPKEGVERVEWYVDKEEDIVQNVLY